MVFLYPQGSGAPGSKKLKDAARRWATGGALAVDEDNTLAALRKFGGTPEQLEQARAALEQRHISEVFEIWPENWRAFELFSAMGRQWDVVGSFGGLVYMGLKLSSLAEVERRLQPPPGDELPDDRTLFFQLRTLEEEAVQHLNARR